MGFEFGKTLRPIREMCAELPSEQLTQIAPEMGCSIEIEDEVSRVRRYNLEAQRAERERGTMIDELVDDACVAPVPRWHRTKSTVFQLVVFQLDSSLLPSHLVRRICLRLVADDFSHAPCG